MSIITVYSLQVHPTHRAYMADLYSSLSQCVVICVVIQQREYNKSGRFAIVTTHKCCHCFTNNNMAEDNLNRKRRKIK